MFTTVEILELAIQIEKNGEQLFQSVLEQRPSDNLRTILAWMVEQEQFHILWLRGMRSQLEAPQKEADPETEQMGRSLLKSMLEQQTFSLDAESLAGQNNLKALIEQIIEFEEDTALFYEMLDTFIDKGQPKQTLKKIIAEEQRHAEVLREFLADPKSLPAGIGQSEVN